MSGGQCNRCTGRGYVVTGSKPDGGFRSRTCQRCGGSGQCTPDQRNPIYWTPARIAKARGQS